MAMAEESVRIERPIVDTSPGVWDRFRGLFSTGSEYLDAEKEDLHYERRLWDHRIERFLDASLPEYLRDFGILDEVALHVRDERAEDLSERSHALMGFVQTFDDDLTAQEERMSAIEKLAKKRGT